MNWTEQPGIDTYGPQDPDDLIDNRVDPEMTERDWEDYIEQKKRREHDETARRITDELVKLLPTL